MRTQRNRQLTLMMAMLCVIVLFCSVFHNSGIALLNDTAEEHSRRQHDSMEEIKQNTIVLQQQVSRHEKEIKELQIELSALKRNNGSASSKDHKQMISSTPPSSPSLLSSVDYDISICKDLPEKPKINDKIVASLCKGGFDKAVKEILQREDEDISIVQIGAHVGYEPNDPIAMKLTQMLTELGSVHGSNVKNKFHWTFVEPSPPNYKRLVKNLEKHSDLCDMNGVNAAVVSDSTKNTTGLVFYSISETIDPETGYDSVSGKKLPYWITQVSSLKKDPILYTEREFQKRGLNFEDYIVETTIEGKRFSDLMQEVTGTGGRKHEPLLLLIDTEGFDCDIIDGISKDSAFLPRYLVFERTHCKGDREKQTFRHLESMGYTIFASHPENIAAVRIMSASSSPQ